jgi:hypothetical protein
MTGRAIRRRAVCLVLGALPLFVLQSCSKPVDLKQTLRVTDLSGGWFDAGIKDGKNRLIPSVTFRVTKSTDEDVRPLSLNFSFKKIMPGGGDEEFDDVFLQSVTFAEGNQTAPITVRAEAGYTGDPPQSRAEMLQNSHFQDMRVVIFARQSSSNWVEIARYDIPRQLLTH